MVPRATQPPEADPVAPTPSLLGLKGLVSPQRPTQPMVCAPAALRMPKSSQGRSPVVRWPLESRNLSPALVPGPSGHLAGEVSSLTTGRVSVAASHKRRLVPLFLVTKSLS